MSKIKKWFNHAGAIIFAEALILGGIIFFIVGWFVVPPISLRDTVSLSSWFNDIGSFIAGTAGILFSLASLVFLFQTLKEQRINFERQQVENRIFELIRLNTSVNISPLQGQLELPFSRIKKLFDEVLTLVTSDPAWRAQCKSSTQRPEMLTENPEYKKWLRDSINISYLFLYYGTETNKMLILRQLNKSYPAVLAPKQFEHFVSEIEAKVSGMKDASDLDISKGQAKYLSQYFRQLFQTIDYVNRQTIIDFDQKYQFIVLLRAQLSIEEQWMLFYNSLSFLGEKWEYVHAAQNDRLITKYNLIKNLPNRFHTDQSLAQMKDVDPSIFYDLVFYETDMLENPTKTKLKASYF